MIDEKQLLEAADVNKIMQFVQVQCLANLEQMKKLKTPLQVHRFVLPLIQNILDYII